MAFRTAAFALLLPAILAAQSPPDRDAAWSEDFRSFVTEFSAGQRDFEKLYGRAHVDAALNALSPHVATDSDIVLGLMKIVASAHIGHTNVRMPVTGPLAFHRLPIALQWFSDGLAVTAATEEHRDAIGLRVRAIGKLTPEALEKAVAPYVAYETDSWLRLQSRTFMVAEEVLRSLGQVDADGLVTMTVSAADGSTKTLRLKPIRWNDPQLMTAGDVFKWPISPVRKDPSKNYRYELLPETKALYIRYNRCADDPSQPFADFAREIFAAVDANPSAIDRVVVDLRTNGGGDSRVIQPLIAGLKERKALTARGHLYALVGPATFSSGLMAAIDLKNIKAILVGEAPGEQLNSYGEVRTLTLPNSKLVVQYSTKFFKFNGAKDGAVLEPDVKVTRTIGEWLGGRDPVLDAALRR